ncbi:MAG: hypothetical protein LBJ21_08725, partial [Acidobacteriota bacterium]|jgi:hypothetical protein|nr:hypothetical protein [Acidobacteriota bacterium]
VLWTPHYDSDGVCLNLANNHPETRFNVENMVTGFVVALRHGDFLGVLRPEYADKIDFEALKQEYSAQHAETTEKENGIFNDHGNDSEDWEQGDD